MDVNTIQQQLFQVIKSRLAADASVADEVAALLDISTDSAYRRMRGEKAVTFDELCKLSSHYRISLDQLMNVNTGFLFQGNLLNSKTFRFDDYLKAMHGNMTYFNSAKHNEFYYLCKDAPIFHHFHVREFAAFKYFFWISTLAYFPDFRNKKIDFNEYSDELFELSQKILTLYDQLNVYEIWTLESLNSQLHQIEYYREAQRFYSDSDVLKVYEAVEKTVDHLEEQARLGYKFKLGDPEKKPLGKYHLYFNEIILPDNSMMVVMDNTKLALMPHTAINYMMTRDVAYCENYYQYVQNLLKRSTLISEVSEKERARFFRIMRERIERRKEVLR
jgi:hypothetical protein